MVNKTHFFSNKNPEKFNETVVCNEICIIDTLSKINKLNHSKYSIMVMWFVNSDYAVF